MIRSVKRLIEHYEIPITFDCMDKNAREVIHNLYNSLPEKARSVKMIRGTLEHAIDILEEYKIADPNEI